MKPRLEELLLKQFLSQIDAECSQLCRHQPNSPAFRNISQSLLADFSWNSFMENLQTKTPMFFQTLSTIASQGDRRNQTKVGNPHNMGICMAAAIILKECNREMNSVQSLVSLHLFTSHVKNRYILYLYWSNRVNW